jgi:hypothetical protein
VFNYQESKDAPCNKIINIPWFYIYYQPTCASILEICAILAVCWFHRLLLILVFFLEEPRSIAHYKIIYLPMKNSQNA